MKNLPHRRGVGFIAALVLVAAPLAVATAAFADDPVVVQSTATVGTGTELRTQWAIPENDLITLTADIDLGDAGCNSGEPVRSDSNNDGDAITIDGQGLYGITQTCTDQRVLRDDAGGETVTLTGLTHFTGGNVDGNGGGLRNDGPVVVVNSDVSGNVTHGVPCEAAAGDASAQVQCENGDGGGIYAGDSGVDPTIIGPGYDLTFTNAVFADNEANDDGGGVYTEGSITATNSQFTDNTAHGEVGGGGRGGGAFARHDVSVTGTSFDGNQALCGVFSLAPLDASAQDDPSVCGAVASGGGFYAGDGATVAGSTFTNNHAYDTGGGFYAWAGADVSTSTFSGNSAGGVSVDSDGFSVQQLPISGAVNATDSGDGSQFCTCVGGGFAVGIGLGAAEVSEGGAQVVDSTFQGNFAGCNAYCFGSGGGFFAEGVAAVSGSTFGDPADEANGNQVGCFVSCGAMGAGAYLASGGTVDTSIFGNNSGGCIEDCGAEGGGIYSGNGNILMSIDGLASSLPDGVTAAAESDGSLRVAQTTFASNSMGCAFGGCGGAGGGLFASGNPTVDITASTFNDNEAFFDGGAIAVNGGVGVNVICEGDCGGTDTTITNSTVTGNTSGFPAAISSPDDDDTLSLVNDTIDSNTIELRDLQSGAAPSAAAQAKVQSCQCYAANVSAFDLTSFGTDVTHPLIDEGVEPVAAFDNIENCWYEDSSSEGFNFSDDDSCNFTESTDNVADGNDPMLGALANNGGPTQTMLPQPGSPLIDAIQPVSECQVDVDQRGVTRPQIKGCDTGAVEVLGASLRVDKVVTGTLGNPVPADGYSFAVSCTDGTSATLAVADATNGGSTDTVSDILPGAVCTVTEAPVVYTNPNVAVQPVVTYDPVAGSPLGEGDTEVVTVTNNYEAVNLLGIAVNVVPKFTG